MSEAGKEKRKIVGYFLKYGRPYAKLYWAGFVLLVFTNGLALLVPWILRTAVDSIEKNKPLSQIVSYALAMAVVALAQAAIRTWSRLTILGSTRRITYDIRNHLFGHLLRLSPSFYDSHRTGDIMSRAVNDLRILHGVYGPAMMNIFNTTIIYTGVLILLFQLDPVLMLISLAIYPPLYLVVQQISSFIYKSGRDIQDQLGRISNKAQENLSSIQHVKIYAQEKREIHAFQGLNQEFRRLSLGLASKRALMLATIGVASGAGMLAILFVGGRHVIQGRITLGDFIAFQVYLTLLIQPTIAMGWIVSIFQRGRGAMERVQEILSEQPTIPPAMDEPAKESPLLEGPIEIRNLCFAHNDVEILKNISLSIPFGSRVGIVGEVGSGKSTLLKLLTRMYEVPDGSIFIGGKDIKAIPVTQLRKSLGYVPQEAFLFSRTLGKNIAFGNPEAPDDDITWAADTAGLSDDIGAFPKGIDTLVGERGYTLSGGQRQRTTLARTLLRRPPYLLFDDTLSSVDAKTEERILSNLTRFTGGNTCVFVTHRLSSLTQFDRIFVLENGKLVEQGTHQELVKSQGVYSRLYTSETIKERLSTL